MGYQSYRTLHLLTTTGQPHPDPNPIIDELRVENSNAQYAFDEEGRMKEGLTWYEDKEDLKEFSKKHPDVLFCMYLEGDENGDKSYTYFKDGKMQVCQAIITFDEYNESSLK